MVVREDVIIEHRVSFPRSGTSFGRAPLGNESSVPIDSSKLRGELNLKLTVISAGFLVELTPRYREAIRETRIAITAGVFHPLVQLSFSFFFFFSLFCSLLSFFLLSATTRETFPPTGSCTCVHGPFRYEYFIRPRSVQHSGRKNKYPPVKSGLGIPTGNEETPFLEDGCTSSRRGDSPLPFPHSCSLSTSFRIPCIRRIKFVHGA